jgi:type IV pilus assembly protein PilY1
MSEASAQTINMADYTNYPMFLNKTGPTNILFIVDLGNAQLPAAYGAYPISAKNTTVTVSSGNVRYASNVNMVDSAGGRDLVSSSDDGSSVNTATTSAPHDLFNPNKEYYGFFDPYRCYAAGSPHFVYGSKKVDGSGNPSVSVQCATNFWDGNFLNWLAMRKKEVTMQALIGGKTLSASSNTDGTANTMGGEDKTGEDGSASNDCSTTSKPCWRYVKWTPVTDQFDTSTPPNLIQGGYTGRIPTDGSLTADAAGAAVATPSAGRFFGLGEGSLYLNVNNTIDPFDGSGPTAPLKFQLSVDLTTEPNVPGPGSLASSVTLDKRNCTLGDDYYAGALICYQRDRSLGLFQKMRKDLFRVGILFADNVGGKGGYLQFRFDDDFNASSITTIRNQAVKPFAPIAEATYEGLCLYRNQQGACYSNSPADFVATTGALYDPFWVCDRDSSTGNCKTPVTGQLVPCCKSFILMISPGIPKGDGNNPDVAQFTNLMSSAVSNVGLTTTQLDDVTYYGKTHDIRDQSTVSGVQNVTFYAVNAMGRAAGAGVLASAAKFGGFDDKNRDNVIDLTGSQACTYPVGSPLGSGTSTSNPEWDQHGFNASTGEYDGPPDCIPDTYFSADEGGDLEKTVNKAIADILKRSASGTAISVLASSATGDGTIYQAYFYPEEFEGLDEIRWTGYVQGLWVDSFGNLREDNGNHKLVYTEDNIVETCLDADNNAKFLRYVDSDGDGKKDSTTSLDCNTYGIDLRQMNGVWEAGRKLALRDISAKPRNLFTWVDLDNNGRVDSGEQIPFNTSGTTPATLAPYLRASATGTFTSTNIINFFLGNQVSNMRNRQKTVDGSLHVWRLGDVINSTPTIVGAPRERFDILYGDQGYRGFAQRWKNRRLMTYVGANDGMIHAFNGGYFHRGDDPGSTEVEHGYYTTGETADDATKPELGEEVWGFIPYYLLPQLRWLAQLDYTHVSFVDLKPKVTEVRIFTEESACGGGTTPSALGCKHPGGWGTVLILGLRYGGSCKACTAAAGENNGGPKLTVKADFNGDGDTTDLNDTRDFLSGYVVLDITDPDVTPTVLSAYTADKLGLTTSYPTVVRMSPSGDGKNDHTNARFFVVVGSGQHGYDGRAASGTFGGANVLAFQLVLPNVTPEVRVLPVGSETYGGFMADPITFDRDLDFRSDAVYVGRTIDPNAAGAGNPGYWWGKFYRLTMGACASAPCTSVTWGVDVSGNRSPTEMVEYVVRSTKRLGPVTAGSTVTLDNSGNTWVFFGSGRFLSRSDKTDLRAQYLVGVKDSVLRSGGCVQTSVTSCWTENLLDVSNAQICVSCASGTQVQNVTGVTTFAGLIDQIQGNTSLSITAKDGWFIELQSGSSTTGLGGERSIVNPTLIGGAVFFPTFVPRTDICVAAGNSYLYSMYYLTGTGYSDPIMGVDASGMAARRTSLGEGVASSVAIQIGTQPTGMAGFYQSSNSVVSKVSPKPITSLWSQYISWVNERN